MALDAITLSMVAGELKAALLGCKVDKVSQPTHDEVVLQLRAYKGSLRLLCSARQGAARVGLTEEKFENPSTAPSFCMLLRKYLCGGRISDIKSVDGERIVLIEMDCTNEMADKVSLTFAVELMGRYSNLVLYYTGGKVIDALKRIDFEASDVRQLLPGLTYTLPPVQDRVFFADITSETLIEKIKETDVPVGDAIMRICSGIGPVVAREIAYRAFGGGEVYGKEMTAEQTKTLENVIVSVKNDIAQGNVHCMVKNDTGKPIEFSFTPLTQYEGGEKVCTLEYFDNFGELLDAYYSTKDRQERLTQKSKELTKAVKNMHERALRKQIARKEELAQSRDCENLRIMGEVLQANLYNVEKGQKSVTLDNFYTNKPIEIALDLRLTPVQNSQKYFKEYKKKQTAAVMLEKLMVDGENEITYLETVLDEIKRAEGEAELNDIRVELKAGGYLKYFKLRDKKQKPADFLRYKSKDGFLMMVGRNNTQNDKLTMKTARGCDLWFHTKIAPGSHVIVVADGNEIPDSTKNEAAQLALYHSSVSGGSKVAIDYTEVRNVKKTGDLKPGMVIYDNYNTAYVTQDADILKNIEKA